MEKVMIVEKVKAKALSFVREMSLARVSESGRGDVSLKIINLGKIMCRTWYEVWSGRWYEVGREYGQDIW